MLQVHELVTLVVALEANSCPPCRANSVGRLYLSAFSCCKFQMLPSHMLPFKSIEIPAEYSPVADKLP